MARQISADISQGVRDLITQITGLGEGSDAFARTQKQIITKLKKSDTMYFLNKREVDDNIAGMAEKFIFHGFFPQAAALQDAYGSYVTCALPKSVLTNRLNVVKLLLCMSERPTSKFLEAPEEFKVEKPEAELEVDWGEYLNEGIDTWAPNFDETSDGSSSSAIEADNDITDADLISSTHLPVIVDSTEKDVVVDLRTNREELLNTVQHTWYNQESVSVSEISDWREANIGILWENFLEDQAMGLVTIDKASFLSEYKVIREIIWQLWNPHTSAVFKLVGNNLEPKKKITISSVRTLVFERFLKNEFIHYVEVLDFFREFSKSVDIQVEESIASVPQTYRSYNNSVQNIIRPAYRKLSELEDKVREQETAYTLLNLAKDLRPIFEPILLLKKIHEEVVVDFSAHSNLTCATTLLSRLHNSLQYSVSKLEQDLRLTLYLESLYHYFTLVDAWLMKNDLTDYSQEFLIVNKNKNLYVSSCDKDDCSTPATEICKLNFDLRQTSEECYTNDGVIKIITRAVLQIGRNLHLLRLLGKFSLTNDYKETIHQEFVRKTLEQLCVFFDKNPEEFSVDKETVDNNAEDDEGGNYKYPVVCAEKCSQPTEMGRLENLVDTTDGFLMLAFKQYFIEKPEKCEPERPTLFEKISTITTTFFPTTNVFEKIFNGILKERFTISGLMVKNLLIEEYLLEKQFQFLRHMFLFFDDLIFPFYRKLFEKTNTCHKNWGNDVWLTFHLQDIIMDIYPEFYEKCTVHVKDNWRQCLSSLEACTMVNLQYQIQWPLNIVINSFQMTSYKEIFRFILRIKWGLYMVNHLSFTDLEQKKSSYRKTQTKSHKVTIMKLKYLKFCLTNILNSIQHYVFSFVFTKCLQKFELDFEKANDLSSIISSHADFINKVYWMVMDLCNAGANSSAFKNILKCVRMLKTMWTNVEFASPDRLDEYYKMYQESFVAINVIVCPVYIFDY